MENFKTNQEGFWAGEFGDEYIDRNDTGQLISGNLSLFNKILNSVHQADSLIEFGSNIGLNLVALKALLPNTDFTAIEINKKAIERLEKMDFVTPINKSILEVDLDEEFDFVLIKGVLIHINPEYLNTVYEKLYSASKRYICLVEYYNPTPVELDYRGHSGKLYKRDFAGEMLDKYLDLRLLDYGFTYHRAPICPQGDANWFLLEKQNFSPVS